MYSENFRRTLFGYFRQSDIHGLALGKRAAVVRSKLESNQWIVNESTPNQIDTIDRLIASRGLVKAESLVGNAESELDFPFAADDVVLADSFDRGEERTIDETAEKLGSDQSIRSELGQAIRDDVGKLGQAVQVAVGTGFAWGLGLLTVKVLYGFNQGIGLFDSVFSPNGLIVFAIGFVFGTFNGLFNN